MTHMDHLDGTHGCILTIQIDNTIKLHTYIELNKRLSPKHPIKCKYKACYQDIT